jgi:hypothetical protein
MTPGDSEASSQSLIEEAKRSESSADGNTSQQAAPESRPRLSILHLLVWTALVAVAMGVDTFATRLYSPADPVAAREWMQRTVAPDQMVARSVRAMLTGAGLGGLLMYFARRRRGIPFPVEPGEWLLVVLGVDGFAQLCSVAARPLISGSSSYLGVYFALLIVESLVPVVGYLLPVWFGKLRGPWRRFFRAAVILAGIWLMMMIAFALTQLGFAYWAVGGLRWIYLAMLILCAVFFGVAALNDFRKPAQRGWVHWAGIVTYVSTFAFQIGWMLYNALVRR